MWRIKIDIVSVKSDDNVGTRNGADFYGECRFDVHLVTGVVEGECACKKKSVSFVSRREFSAPALRLMS